MTSAREHRYFFVHVMKTAGGTFVQHALANFARDEVYPYRRIDRDLDIANVRIDYLTTLPAERYERLRFYGGHFPFIASELLGGDFVVVTILRDPVERVVSYLRHCKQYHDHHRDLRLEAIYEDPFFFPCFVHNHQTKLFSMTPTDRLESYMDVVDIDDERLQLAKHNLDRVDVLGFQEHFDEVLQEMARRYAWRIGSVQQQHVSDGSDVPLSFQRRIADDNAADMAFYEHARSLHEERRRERQEASPCIR